MDAAFGDSLDDMVRSNVAFVCKSLRQLMIHKMSERLPGTQLLQYMCSPFGRCGLLREMLIQGIVTADDDNSFALRMATDADDVGLARLLIEAPANPARPNHHRTPLMTACRNGNVEMVCLLISATHHPASANVRGSDALRLAAERGHAEVVAALINMHRRPAQGDARESIALRLAAANGHAAVVLLLIGASHHPAEANANDSIALRLASANGHLEVVLLLIGASHHPADANTSNSAGLRLAAFYRHLEVVLALIGASHHPAKANALDSDALRSAVVRALIGAPHTSQ